MKRLLAFLFLVLFLSPGAIQTIHAFKNHPHEVCISKIDQHIHKKEIDCSDFHSVSPTFSLYFSIDTKQTPTTLHTSFYIGNSQTTKKVNYTKKSPRGPPISPEK